MGAWNTSREVVMTRLITTLIMIYIYGSTALSLVGAGFVADTRRSYSRRMAGGDIVLRALGAIIVTYVWLHSSFEYRTLFAVLLWALEALFAIDSINCAGRTITYTRLRTVLTVLGIVASTVLISFIVLA